MQRRAGRQRSTLGPLLLIGTGALLLLAEGGKLRLSTILGWLSRGWPLLLVGAGVLLLLEWGWDLRSTTRRQAGVPRRSLGAGAVLLLLLFTLTGVALSVLHHGDFSPALLDRDTLQAWGLDQLFARQRIADTQLNAPLGAGGQLTVQNYRGKITLSGTSEDGGVHVTVHQHFTAWQEGTLRDKEARDKPTLVAADRGLLLTAAGEDRDEADLVIQTPHNVGVRIAPGRGEMEVSELRGDLRVEDHRGNIDLTGLTGGVYLNLQDDDASVTAHSLTGNLTLEGHAGDLALSDLEGTLTLHGDFFGTTHFEHVKGPVHFQSSFTDLACAGISGEVTVQGRSEIEADGLEGPILLSTTDRDLKLKQVRGGVTVTDTRGSVSVGLADLLGPVSLKTTDGSVTLAVPEDKPFRVNATAMHGSIENDLGLQAAEAGERMTLAAQIQSGGPLVQLQTTSGDIHIGTSDDD